MVSSVTEENITKLREAVYLDKNIAHRLPAEGQITPTVGVKTGGSRVGVPICAS